MEEQKPNNTEPLDADLDRVLDTALAKYAAVEPRAGLESRILANLRAEQIQVRDHSWWRWGLAAAVAAVFVIAMALVVRPGKPSKPTVADHEITVQPAHEPEQHSVNQEDHGHVPQPIRRRRASSYLSEARRPPSGPKLNQFPSPQPLSEQELALAHYVRDFPQEAVIVAQSQEESEVEMRKKMGKTELVRSDEEER